MPTRNDYVKLIHLGAKRLGYVDTDDYRLWLSNLTGKSSTKQCSERELQAVVNTLRACHALDHPRLKAVKGDTTQNGRPTKTQWSVAHQRCLSLGMTGCDDSRFTEFTKKVCKVEHPRFLTRDAMRKLIAALNNWIANTQKKETGK